MNKTWSFEYQWKNYDTKYLTYGLSEKEEFLKFCNDLKLEPNNLINKKILDAGCGSGRLTKSISRYSKKVYGVDLITLPKSKNLKFIKANIMSLPFDNSFFDIVYCEGVLHHTPDPKKAFMELARVNKERLYIMVYSKRNIFMLFRKYFMIYKYPYSIIRLISLIFALLSYIPINVLNYFLKYNREFTIKSLDFFIFDYLSPQYQSVHNFEEIKKWYQEAGYNTILSIEGHGIQILGIK